jgi:hypothetical protein
VGGGGGGKRTRARNASATTRAVGKVGACALELGRDVACKHVADYGSTVHAGPNLDAVTFERYAHQLFESINLGCM